MVGSMRSLRSALSRARMRSLVRSREPAVSDDVRDQDRRELPGLIHGARSGGAQNSTNTGWSRAFEGKPLSEGSPGQRSGPPFGSEAGIRGVAHDHSSGTPALR